MLHVNHISQFMRRAVAVAMASAVIFSVNPASAQSSLNSILDQIVATDSGSWMFWSYDRGSMRNARVLEHSPDGSRTVVRGDYTYNGGASGWVRIVLVNDQLSCLEFWNEGRCRPLGRPLSRDLVGVIALGAVSGLASGIASGSSASGNSSARQRCLDNAGPGMEGDKDAYYGCRGR